MAESIEYEMTQADFEELMEACQPVPYIVVGGIGPTSPRENARAAWIRLGQKMGFDGITARPSPGKSELFFLAVPTPASKGGA